MEQAFWPSFTGKPAEAMRHFEILVAQQEALVQQPHFVDTYLWLSKVYKDQGKAEMAIETLERGYALFPNNEQLRKSLDR